MNVQTPTKLRRNAPCHCGSGWKYKKCCGKKEGEIIMSEGKPIKIEEAIEQANAPRLKNEFREEVRDPYAGISEDELVARDQAVLLKELRFRKEAIEADHAHFEAAIERGKAVRRELLAMPKSPYREAVLQDLDAQIKGQAEKAGTLRLPRGLKLTLMALEELFVEDVKKLAKPFGPMIDARQGQHPGPESDEDEDDLTIDEEDNPNEVI